MPTFRRERTFRRSHGSLHEARERSGVAETSPERGFHYSVWSHSGSTPIGSGWFFRRISQFNWAHDSWTAPLDALRLAPNENATDTSVRQVVRLVAALEERNSAGVSARFVFDAGSEHGARGHGFIDVSIEVPVRLSSQRVVHFDPASSSGGRGRPLRHGVRFALSDAETWTKP